VTRQRARLEREIERDDAAVLGPAANRAPACQCTECHHGEKQTANNEIRLHPCVWIEAAFAITETIFCVAPHDRLPRQ
jgi:hypothetical protein